MNGRLHGAFVGVDVMGVGSGEPQVRLPLELCQAILRPKVFRVHEWVFVAGQLV